MQVIGRVLRESLDECIALDVAEVERSRMPELMRAAKKPKGEDSPRRHLHEGRSAD